MIKEVTVARGFRIRPFEWALGSAALACLAVGSAGMVVGKTGGVEVPPRVLKFPRIDLGELQPGEERIIDVPLENLSGRPISLIGSLPHCGIAACSKSDSIPMRIEPGETRKLQLEVSVGNRGGSFEQDFLVYTDSPDQPEFHLHFQGRVVSPTEAEPIPAAR